MNILHRRPLFLCCAVLMLAVTAGFVLPLPGYGLALILLALGAAGLSVLFGYGFRNRYRAILAVAVCLTAVLGLLRAGAVFHSRDVRLLRGLEQKTVTVEGVVTDRRGSGGYLTAYTLSLEKVNGTPVSGNALLTCYYVSDLQPGYAVIMEAAIVPLSEAAGDGYDATALLGDGYTTGLISETEATVTVTREETHSPAVRAGALRRSLAARLNLLTAEGGEGIPSALLLGDKQGLEDHVRRDFARAGVSHLLAISGLHVTLLFGLLAGLLRLLRLPKRVRTVLMGLCALGYLVLLGFPPSATRAVIMLGAVYLSVLLTSRADPLTSLGLAGAVILTVTPWAAADAGFWMSFLATLGLVTVLPALRSPRKQEGNTVSPLRRLLSVSFGKLAVGLITGIVAMSFTLFAVALAIGELGWLSPLSTLLLTPLCAVLLVLSVLCLPASFTPLGSLLGALAGKLCTLMTALAEVIAKPSWVTVSVRHPAVPWVAALMLTATLVLLVIRLPERRRRLIFAPILAGWVVIAGVLGADHLMTRREVDVTYLQPSSQSDSLVLVSGNRGFVCDLSNGSLTALSDGAREAEERGATELSAVMLTHYHSRTSGALETFLDRETVRALWLPQPSRQEDYFLLLACLEKAERAGVPAFVYRPGESLRIFGEGSITLETAFLDRSTQPLLLVSVAFPTGEREAKTRLLYCGSAVFESTLAHRARELTAGADTVILGSHGPLFKAPFGDSLDLTEAETVILSAYGDTAGWFDPVRVSEGTTLWIGPFRMTLKKR